ncbi:acyl-CoA dehydrogenase, long-chain specific [Variovorax paradoxus B4]|uniref:Acyl-[acyl-carrier-protein] dehydrogenase MbtN n=1 Tax=Variovorax paradoxus B4 TaxID=1246301 RepID=T1XKL8_VARPD|nr:acyl-CoA dehydrogenase family protein [Variovorax paradoxus]AGU52670.1 acyl-CoA dehydrogenase, long-chain specific [Variovorax paradoxus B4]
MNVTRPWMNEELEMLRASARRFFERECVPHEPRWRAQHHADREIWTKAGRAGLLCASIPEAYGGGGGSFLHEAVICEEQMRAMAQSFSNNVHSGIVAHYLLAYGTEAQKQRWLPRMASGELVAAIAMTEPGAGTDLQRIKAQARRDGDHWRISGSKTFITNGMHAGLVCVAAKTDAAAGGKGISLLMVETEGTPGFRRGPLLDKMGQKTLDTTELFFDDVRVPADSLLGGEEGRGFAQLMQQLPRERLLIAVGAVATMKRAIGDTLEYVRDRQVFGQPLLKMQNTRFKLAECETQAQVARAFVDDCIARLMRGELDVPTAAMAKWWTTDACCRIVDECLQLHGGYGFMNEYPIARLYADVRVGRIYGGANEVMKEIIARAMEKQ